MTAENTYMIRTVSDEWLREQTTTPSTDGWYKLVVAQLNRKPSSKAYMVNGEKRWNADAVKKVLRKTPQELKRWR